MSPQTTADFHYQLCTSEVFTCNIGLSEYLQALLPGGNGDIIANTRYTMKARSETFRKSIIPHLGMIYLTKREQ